MSKTVDYYFTPVSPWAYLGHARFIAIATKAGAAVRPRPVDYGKIFPVSGGLPLKQRPAQRQAYRFMELKRWHAQLDLPLNLEPKYFPVDAGNASLMLTACLAQGGDATMRLAGGMLRAVWAEERNLADADTLVSIAHGAGLDGRALLDAAKDTETATTYARHTAEAIDLQVFGAPTYVYEGELFWGQDRLDFLERALVS
jgi:2-hydroxychromene-2-carboxylate isomerase